MTALPNSSADWTIVRWRSSLICHQISGLQYEFEDIEQVEGKADG